MNYVSSEALFIVFCRHRFLFLRLTQLRSDLCYTAKRAAHVRPKIIDLTNTREPSYVKKMEKVLQRIGFTTSQSTHPSLTFQFSHMRPFR